MHRVVVIGLRLIAGFLLLVTLLSIIESNHWWIRVWDFPRVQILVALGTVAALALWRDRSAGKWLAVACAVAGAWQIYRIYPYTRLARPELPLANRDAGSDDTCFSVLSLNVLESNRDYARTARLIERTLPDILLGSSQNVFPSVR